VHFNAAHRIYNPAWTDEKNADVFGKCANPLWHGHNYELEVTVAGTPHPDTGYVFDLGHLARLLDEHILNQVDHRNLNEQVDFLTGLNPTTENLAIAFWRQLAPHIPPPARLHSLRLWETPRNSVEYRGETLADFGPLP
jgi:6-pyruvoyltetrahydropterin/6-carboxytetrahydropterin synthase